MPSEVGVLQNESIQLVCRAQGTPAPVIQWLKDGEAISGAENKGLRYRKYNEKKEHAKLDVSSRN